MDVLLEKGRFFLWTVLSLLGLVSTMLLGILAWEASQMTNKIDEMARSIDGLNLVVQRYIVKQDSAEKVQQDHENRLREIEKILVRSR